MKAIDIPFTKRLQVKINLVLIPLILLILGAFTVYNYFVTRDKMENELNSVSTIVSERLAKSFTEPFWSLDDEVLRESIKSEMADPRVMSISITDQTDKVYMAFSREGMWSITEGQLPIEGKTITASKPIQRKQETLGKVEVIYTTKFINSAIRTSLVTLAITTIVLIIVVSLATNIVVRRIVILPLSELTEVVDQMSVGNLNIQNKNNSNDEVGALSEAVERMRVSLVIAIKQLKKLKAKS